MTWIVAFDSLAAVGVIRRDPQAADDRSWAELVQSAFAVDPQVVIANSEIRLSWGAFLILARTVSYLRRRDGITMEYTDEARVRLELYAQELRAVEAARRAQGGQAGLSEEEVMRRLGRAGWDFDKRRLTPSQVRDLLAALAIPHGANFSVPGAGKTTVTLALHLLAVPQYTRLLVISPKNAFPAWDAVLEECLQDPVPRFARLVGGRSAIRAALADDPHYAIIGYGQLVRVADEVQQHLLTRPVHLVLDESHRIKGGTSTQTGSAALALGPLAIRRDILSGTPLPNAPSDLAPQFEFLWPGQAIGAQIQHAGHPAPVIRPLYVRTRQSELGLPVPVVDYVAVDMSDPQRVLYGLLRNDVLRQLAATPRALTPGARTSVMRLLQAAVDPQVAAEAVLASAIGDPSGDHLRAICHHVLKERLSPRLRAVIRQTREVTGRGRKIVIWAPFVATIERLVEELEVLGVVSLHGGVPAGDEEDDATREGIIRRFHDDPDCLVLVANPAAGGEGISLHHVCRDALYVGRTYNGAHYLQSRDRIHRLGLDPSIPTRITVFESTAPGGIGSIDLSVRRRLDTKIDRMSLALEDEDLQQLALESASAEAQLDDGLTFDDLADLLRELTGQAPNGA